MFFWRDDVEGFCKKIVIGFFVFITTLSSQSYGDCYDCCDDWDPCCNNFWLDADYLYWKIKDSPEPVPLVLNQPIRGGPSTVVLGNKKIDLGWRSGAKFALGYWFDDSHCLGCEVNYFFLPKESKRNTVASDANGSPRLRVPFFNVQTGLEDSIPLSTPAVFRGIALLKVDNSMKGAELNVIGAFPSCDCQMKFGWLAGFRWWNFNEHLKFHVDSPVISPPSIYTYGDKFKVKNNFYGAQIGGSFDYDYCNFFFNLKAKVALGAMCQETDIDGFFTTNEFTGAPQTFDGGFFALPTNIGHHKKTRFSVLPELGVNFGYQVTEYLSLRVGYSGLYVSNVLWAGKLIDRNINPSQSANIDFTPTPVLVGEASPQPRNKSEGFWAQGLNVGVEFKY